MAEMIQNRSEVMEQTELTMSPEQRDQLIEQYNQCIDDALKEANMDMVDYYKEKLEPLKEARNREQREYWENKKQQIAEESAQRQKEMQLANIQRRTPTYGMPTTESGWLDWAKNEFRQHGESWYYNQCMKNAAECHVEESFYKK